jgi:DNA-binding transcriptional LysR family regulator
LKPLPKIRGILAQRKGVALTPAGKSFLIDARRILEDCESSIRKAQRISRGEIGELAVGYISALTHGLRRRCWRGAFSVGILVPSARPVLELLVATDPALG